MDVWVTVIAVATYGAESATAIQGLAKVLLIVSIAEVKAIAVATYGVHIQIDTEARHIIRATTICM